MDAALAAQVSDRDDERLDQAAFVALFERSQAQVFAYLRARCPSDEDAADLTATAFERAWSARERFTGAPDARVGWIFRIARRLAIDAARRRSTARRGLIFWPPADPAPDPATLVISDERDRLLARHLVDLPEPQREAILLRYAAGLTTHQIAEVIGKREAATQKLITRALARLKEAYGDDE